MAKTWDTSRTGGGTYEFTQDPQGRYTLRSVGFKGISKLNLPELKTGAAATTAADAPKDVAALSAQTTEAFGDVTPFYYDQEGRIEDPKYVTMRKEDTARDLEVSKRVPTVPAGGMEGGVWGPQKYLQPRKEVILPRKKPPLPERVLTGDRRGWSTEAMTAKPKEVTQVGRITKPEILKEKAAAAQKIKPVERFPPGQQFGSRPHL